jgi:putative nucleotidyltransferase with HDIG domain
MCPGELDAESVRDDVALLLSVSMELAESLDLDTVLQTAVYGAVKVLGLDTGAIYLLQEDEIMLGATVPGLPDEFPASLRRAALADHPHVRRSLESRIPIFIPDILAVRLTAQEREVAEIRGLASSLYVPVVARDHAEGVLIVGTQDGKHEFTQREVDLCRALSAQIGYAIANARLYESVETAARELRSAYDATLEGWSRALEMRDEDTAGHTARVTALTLQLAVDLGVPGERMSDIRRGALLHDIGKMAVPDAILQKPGPLDEEEWTLMRRHPEYAYTLLSGIGFLVHALEIPYCHHERWDGSGYPRGLKGAEIPLAARIFAVIDVYDALTSDRPYRHAWTQEAAREHIRSRAGIDFDPAVVDAFLQRIEQARQADE